MATRTQDYPGQWWPRGLANLVVTAYVGVSFHFVRL